MGINLSRLAARGANIVEGNFFKVATTVTPKGTKVHHVFDESENLLTKVVLPGAKNGSAKFDTMSTDYLKGRAMQVLAQRDGRRAVLYQYTEANAGLKKVDEFHAGEYGIPTSISNSHNSYPGSVEMYNDSYTGLVVLHDSHGLYLTSISKPNKPPEGTFLFSRYKDGAERKIKTTHHFVGCPVMNSYRACPDAIGLSSKTRDPRDLAKINWFA